VSDILVSIDWSLVFGACAIHGQSLFVFIADLTCLFLILAFVFALLYVSLHRFDTWKAGSEEQAKLNQAEFQDQDPTLRFHQEGCRPGQVRVAWCVFMGTFPSNGLWSESLSLSLSLSLPSFVFFDLIFRLFAFLLDCCVHSMSALNCMVFRVSL
jgi:hypothetical protein